jgi:hypothetical protein
MLALYFAIALAPHTHFTIPHSNSALINPVQQSAALIPSGASFGTWTAPTVFEDGTLTLLLEDGSGLPIWVLDGHIGSAGGLYGRLIPLEYATNPALSLPELAITGHALLGANGEGVFSASIYAPFLDVPVYPFGKIEGVLKQAALPAADTFTQARCALANTKAGQMVLSRVDMPSADVNGGVITCPAAVSVANVSAAGAYTGLGATKLGNGVGTQGIDVSAQAAGSFVQQSRVIECPWVGGEVSFAGQASAGQFAQTGATKPSGMDGIAYGRWYLLL